MIHFKISSGLKASLKKAQAYRPQNGPVHGIKPTEVDHGQDFGQSLNPESAGIDEPQHMGKEASRYAGPEGGKQKTRHFGAPRVHGHGLGGGFIIAHGI